MLHVKSALICTVVGIGLGLAIGRFAPNFPANASVPTADLSRPVAFVTNAIVPADVSKSENGPQRLTDW
jgi:hypothetical protein